MAANTRIELCASLLAAIIEHNKEILVELQFNNAVERYRKEHPVLEKLTINDDLSIDASQMPDDERSIAGIRVLVGAAGSIMEIFIGSEEAERNISAPLDKFNSEHAADIQKFDLGKAFPNLLAVSEGVTEEGVSESLKFGIEKIDKAIRYELSNDHALLLRGKQGIERDLIIAFFVKEGLESGGSVIFATGKEPPDAIKRRLMLLGVDVPKYVEPGYLIFIDWYSKLVERVHGVEVTGNVVRCSSGLTNVSVAFDSAFSLCQTQQVRVVVDFVSDAIINVDFDTALDFMGALRAKLRTRRFCGLFTLNGSVHSKQELGAFQEHFDCVLDISQHVEQGAIQNCISLVSFPGVFDKLRCRVNVDKRGAWCGDDESEREANGISFSDIDFERTQVGGPGMEIMTGGGVPRGSSLLFMIPSQLFPIDVVLQHSSDSLAAGNSLVVILSSSPPAELIARLTERGFQTTNLINTGMLRIVDWNSQKNKRVMGVEDMGGVLSASKDIMHLGVALNTALNQINSEVKGVAVIDMLSYSLREYDLRTIHHFSQTIRAQFRKAGITSIVLLDKGAQDSRVVAALAEIFDGTIDISEHEGELILGITSMKDSFCMRDFKPLTRLRKGLTIDIAGSVKTLSDEAGPEPRATAEADGELDKVMVVMEEIDKKRLEVGTREMELKRGLDGLQERILAFEKEYDRSKEHRDELKHVLKLLDDLLEHLPESHIEDFANSEHFKKYEKILDLYLGDEE